MSSPHIPGQPRQLSEVILVGLCLVALGLLAVALVGSGGSLADDSSDEIQPAEMVSGLDRQGLIGGGSLGGAERNPLGSGVENETNPFASQSGERLFTAETSHSTYWRVDGYDEYTNGTWVRTGGYEEYEPPLSPTGPVDDEHMVSITTEQDAAVLPTAWQPATISGQNESSLAVSAETGIHTASEYSAGSQYSVTAYQYDPDPRALAVSRANYPATIEQRYATPPEDVDDRITALSDEITQGAVTPVQAVCKIDDWVATNKEYDPESTHDAGQDPLEQYLFEMDSGNAEYAASSLVVLARSQGIPARYVTGYTPGEQSPDSEDQYVVREVNAHAWAEVYVTGHGWIPFDPTPTDDRLAVEQQAAGDGGMVAGSLPADCMLDVDFESLTDDQFSGGVDTPTTGGETDSTPSANGDTDSTPSDDGETDSTPSDDAGAEFTSPSDGDPGGTIPDDDIPSEFEDLPSAPAGTNVTIQTDPNPLIRGGTTTATVFVDGEPLSGGEITVGGHSVGSTDRNGTIEFTAPTALEPGITALIVGTDDFEEGQLIRVVEFELTAEPQQLIGLPGDTATVTATAGETAVSDLELRDGDSVVGTTDADGEATVPVSLFSRTTIEATYFGATTTTQIENRLVGLVLRGIGILGIVGIVGFVISREYDLRAILRSRAELGWQAVINLFGWAGSSLRQLPEILQAARKRGIWGSMLALRRLPHLLISRLRRRLPDSVLAYLVALAIGLYRAVVRGDKADGSTSSSKIGSTVSTTKGNTQNESDHSDGTTVSTVRAVWQTFVRLVVRRISPTQTPGEIARTAIHKGFPRRPVLRLTDAFRTTAYGPAHSETLVEEAQSALDALESDRNVDADAESAIEESQTSEDRQ